MSVPTIGEAIDLMLASKSESNYRICYLRSMRCYLSQFARGREGKPIDTFNEDVIGQWFSGRNEAPASRNSNMGRLSSLFQFAWRRRWIPENPCRRIEAMRIVRKAPRILTVHEAARALVWTRRYRPWALSWLVLNLMCGLRVNESIQIGWDDIDLEGGTITVSAAASKVRQRRIIYLMPAAVEWLKLAKLMNARMKPNITTSRRWLRFLREFLRMKEWPQNALRHSCASYWVAAVPDLARVSRMLGNSPNMLLNHYLELVKKEDAAKFWSLIPDVAELQRRSHGRRPVFVTASVANAADFDDSQLPAVEWRVAN